MNVAPALHTSTTFRYTDDLSRLRPTTDESLYEAADLSKQPPYVYSRLTAPNSTRFEQILATLLKGDVVTYSSGLSAFHAALTFLNPKVVAIGHGQLGGYHGCHGVLNLYQRVSGCKIVDLFADDAVWDAAGLGKGDVVHMESPLNPTGIAYNIAEFADRVRKRGAYLTVDATFGPPPLQNPFVHGADIVMHSGTKYFGGHSDMLCGVLAVNPERERERSAQGMETWWKGLMVDRIFLGSVMGSLEGWLGIRSLRTLELRVQRQSQNATELVAWLDSRTKEPGVVADTEAAGSEGEAVRKTIAKVMHASLQKEDSAWLKEQMPKGFGPVFAITMQSREMARRLPSKLQLFHHATSLGGVESLIEWRTMSDKEVDDKLLRVSVGVENVEDLQLDLLNGFKSLLAEL
ncbi:MAG: hypothetical protein M1821_001971 [Bathelium mastoideum]|nr:MAG: hypothetical protein M1821_001971 [Bathelium mastoideum]